MRKIKATKYNQITRAQADLLSDICKTLIEDFRNAKVNVVHSIIVETIIKNIASGTSTRATDFSICGFSEDEFKIIIELFESKDYFYIPKEGPVFRCLQSAAKEIVKIDSMRQLIVQQPRSLQKPEIKEDTKQEVDKNNLYQLHYKIFDNTIANLDCIVGQNILKIITPSDILEEYGENADVFDEVKLAVELSDGILYFIHEQDCCEDVYLDDGLEDLKSMVGEKILNAYEAKSSDAVVPADALESATVYDSYTYTFYNISTAKHDTCLRFIGISNGYYSEDMDIAYIPKSIDNTIKKIDGGIELC